MNKICFLSLSVFGQIKYFSQVDSSGIEVNSIIKEHTTTSFFDGGLGEAEFDVFDPNKEMLEACIFFTINRLRIEKKRDALRFNPILQQMTRTYTEYYSSSRFSSNIKNRLRLTKIFKNIPRYLYLDFKLYNGYVNNLYAVDYDKGGYYFLRSGPLGKLNLYRGNKRGYEDAIEANEEPDEIGFVTYNEFAERLLFKWLRGKSAESLKSRSYDYLAVSIQLDKRTMYGKKVPRVKAVYMLGGHRNKLILDGLK